MSLKIMHSFNHSKMICADEVAGIVADIGASSCKFGTAGQDSPHHVFRSACGVITNSHKRRVVTGDSEFRLLREGMEIVKPLQDSRDDECISNLIAHGISSMRVNPEEYPILFSDSHFKTVNQKKFVSELCFEQFNSPGIYVANTAMLTSFSVGKPTSVVVDLGASCTRVSCIVDGYELVKSVVLSNKGGDWIDSHVLRIIQNKGIVLKPWYEVSHEGRRPLLTSSFREMHVADIVRDVKRWMCLVPPFPSPNRAEYIDSFQIPPYVLPDGTELAYFDELCTVPELLFAKTRSPSASSGAETGELTQMVFESLSRCDVDARRELAGAIVLGGGGSLISGLGSRLSAELVDLLPASYKPKIVTSLPIERQFAAWIGGSILGICGSFHQKWLSRAEYMEMGGDRAVLDKFI